MPAKVVRARRTPVKARRARGPATLAIDIGGSGLKASVLDPTGQMMVERVRVATPHEVDARTLVKLLVGLVKDLPPFDRVSVGFPGVVRKGIIRTAPNLGTERLGGFDLAASLERRFGRPVRVVNDADMQGYAAITGKGVEMVITLGTGFGTSLFADGRLCPHMEFAHHQFRKSDTYEEQLGELARENVGNERWSNRVILAIDALRALINFDRIYVGGGNARRLEISLPRDARVVDNSAGILGGIRLWDDATGGSA